MPCWVEVRQRKFSYGSRRRSRILIARKRGYGALTIVPESVGLPVFGLGITMVFFLIAGMLQWLTERS